MTDTTSETLTGSQFVLGALLGSGGFGEVYLSRMTSVHGIEQDVAVKLLNANVHPKSQPVSRMRDEGRLLAALNHPAILRVTDFCYLDGRIGLVTEFVPGADLHDCIDPPDPIPERAVVQVTAAVADALQAAHESPTPSGGRLGLVHRDIKPANIRVTPHGTVKLLDFGIAKDEDDARETHTRMRATVGTPQYMAPEVLTCEVTDALPSRDVFALGCTLYEALTGELFFDGLDHEAIVRLSNREERFAEHRSSRMLKLVRHQPRIVELLSRMLRYEHTDRPSHAEVAQTCQEVAESMDGLSLWQWARKARWPEVGEKTGPWSGRKVADTMVHVTAFKDPSATGAASGGGAQPTLVVPDAHPTLIADAEPSGARRTAVVRGATRVTSFDTGAHGPVTQVVVVDSRRRRTWMTPGNLFALVVFGALAFGGYGMFVDGRVFYPEFWTSRARALIPGMPSLDAVDLGALGPSTEADGPEAPPADPEAPLPAGMAKVTVAGSASVYLHHGGPESPVLLVGGEYALVPAGPLTVKAAFGMNPIPSEQFATETVEGQRLTVKCDLDAASCARF